MRTRLLFAVLSLVVAAACGSSSSNPPKGTDAGSGATPTITISSFAFSPTNLMVAPGATVTVVNSDTAPHSVTSTTDAGTYVPGAVNGIQFDTGQFTGTKTFTIPSTATVGTVVPYFCTMHTSMMANSAKITIGAASASASEPDGGTAAGPIRY